MKLRDDKHQLFKDDLLLGTVFLDEGEWCFTPEKKLSWSAPYLRDVARYLGKLNARIRKRKRDRIYQKERRRARRS